MFQLKSHGICTVLLAVDVHFSQRYSSQSNTEAEKAHLYTHHATAFAERGIINHHIIAYRVSSQVEKRRTRQIHNFI